MSRSKTRVLKLFRKQKGNCYLCGKGMSYTNKDKDNYATIDHELPRSKMREMGIEYQRGNLKLACKKCNFAKGDQLPAKYKWLEEQPCED